MPYLSRVGGNEQRNSFRGRECCVALRVQLTARGEERPFCGSGCRLEGVGPGEGAVVSWIGVSETDPGIRGRVCSTPSRTTGKEEQGKTQGKKSASNSLFSLEGTSTAFDKTWSRFCRLTAPPAAWHPSPDDEYASVRWQTRKGSLRRSALLRS